MTFRWDTSELESSDTIKAKYINESADALQNFVNEGIGEYELKSTRDYIDNTEDPYTKKGWVDSQLIYRPEFYGAPSPRMMAVSGQTHFRKTSNDWSKGAVFNPSLSGSSWQGVPGCCTTLKLRHSATVNIMCSFYMFEFGGITESQAAVADYNQNSDVYWFPDGEYYVDYTDRSSNYGYFLKNDLGDGRIAGYETRLAGKVRLQVNDRRYRSTERAIYTSHVDARRPANFYKSAWADDIPLPYFQTFTVNNANIFMPMIGRHQHHIVCQVDLSEGVHNVGLVFKPKAMSSMSMSHAEIKYSNDASFQDRKEFPKIEAPRIPRNKNVFFLARNLVVDCYYKDNDPE